MIRFGMTFSAFAMESQQLSDERLLFTMEFRCFTTAFRNPNFDSGILDVDGMLNLGDGIPRFYDWIPFVYG